MPDDPATNPAPANPAPAPQPAPAPASQPAPAARSGSDDELPEHEPPPTTRSFRSLREAHNRTVDENKELKRQLGELQAQTGAVEQLRSALVEQTVIAQATGLLSDPTDAIRMLDLASIKPDDKGRVDPKPIREKIEKLVEQKPYLRGSASSAPRPLPGPGGQPPTPTGAGNGHAAMNDLIRGAARGR